MKKLFLLFVFILMLFANTSYVYGDNFREAMDTFAKNVSNAAIKSLDREIRHKAKTSEYEIKFLVDKDGNFSNFKIILSTNNKEVDEHIINAIKSQAHKYPLPAQMANFNEDVEIVVVGNHESQILFNIVYIMLFGSVLIGLFILFLHIITIGSFSNFIESMVDHFSPFFASLKRNLYVKSNFFALKKQNSYKLFNDNIIFIYNYKERIFICNEIKTKRNFTIEGYIFPIKKTFDDFFDDILYSFNKKTDYNDVLKKLNTGFLNIVNYDIEKEDKETTKETEIPVINVNPKVDINNSDAETIAKFPGVNIINAKKAIKYRDLHGGFKTKEEFFKQIKLEEHFIKQIVADIEIGEYIKPEKKSSIEGRIIDIE